MNITLNGDPKSLEDNTTVSELLAEMGLTSKRIAVELNQEIISASLHAKTILHENDTMEIVQAIGGG